MSTKTDLKLLELAAKATGEEFVFVNGEKRIKDAGWNPLESDGQALRLAVKLNLSADFFDDVIAVGYTPNSNQADQVEEPVGTDPYAATRRAIVRVAAEIGKAMK